MLSFFSGYYYIIIILQIICVIHAIKNGNQRWIWFIVLIPLIGCVAYIFTEMFTRQGIGQVQSGVNSIFNPSGSIRKLKENLKFRDTFDNRIALADAYLAGGEVDNAISIYETSLVSAFADHEHGNLQLLSAYFEKGQFEDVKRIAQKVYNLPQFRRNRANMLYAIALANTGETGLADQEFSSMNAKFANYECRYEYGKFLFKNGRREEAANLFQEMLGEASHLTGPEKRNSKPWLSKVKEELKNIQAA